MGFYKHSVKLKELKLDIYDFIINILLVINVVFTNVDNYHYQKGE